MPFYIHWVDEMIIGNLCIITDEVRSIPSICKGSVVACIEELICSKVCGSWVPPVLIDAPKMMRKAIVTACWHYYSNWKWGLPVADCHGEWEHSEPKSKCQLWNGAIEHPQGRRNSRVCCKLKKSWSESSVMRRMCSCELLAKGDNSDSNHYIETLRSRILTCVEFILQEKCLKCFSSMTVLVCTTEAIINCGWTHFLHQSSPCTIRLPPVWSSKKIPMRTPLYQWRGTTDCLAPVAAEKGEQVLLGWECMLLLKDGKNIFEKIETTLK